MTSETSQTNKQTNKKKQSILGNLPFNSPQTPMFRNEAEVVHAPLLKITIYLNNMQLGILLKQNKM